MTCLEFQIMYHKSLQQVAAHLANSCKFQRLVPRKQYLCQIHRLWTGATGQKEMARSRKQLATSSHANTGNPSLHSAVTWFKDQGVSLFVDSMLGCYTFCYQHIWFWIQWQRGRPFREWPAWRCVLVRKQPNLQVHWRVISATLFISGKNLLCGSKWLYELCMSCKLFDVVCISWQQFHVQGLAKQRKWQRLWKDWCSPSWLDTVTHESPWNYCAGSLDRKKTIWVL